ncbi:ATP-binding protein [Sphingobacterium olei]|uniref:ATP-binding protein n=1 Tax=Sphingobacterium olei TaxID=2571155 RepID=A0A4V5MN46_9SPHI|nr:ATP-binding protein [Sphingobacterium olei]TJZ63298.1 ATP-binding protein [Sphingobacterium olei]
MAKSEFLQRELKSEIQRLSSLYAVIVVTGPRQSGKTTLCRNHFSTYHYINLENPSTREQVLTAPKAFLEQHADGLIVDEAQHLPELFSYIQVIVDENEDSNFVLTGSSNFSLMQGITQSLAGRAAILTLLPLSLSELGIRVQEKGTDTILLNGGYPVVWTKGIPVQDVAQNYYNTYIERDIRQLLNVKDITRFQTFIKLCAGRIGTEFNASALSNELGVSVPTIQEWLSVLEASYVIFRLPPFFRNIGKRLVKSPKLYFYDTGLACFLLGIENEQQLATHPLRGAIFENMVVLEFFKNRYNQGKLPHLYFYRDKSQHEVDLIEEKGTKLYAYEVKSAKAFTKNFIKSLGYFRNVVGDDVVSTQVIYDGENDIYSSENGMVNFRNIKFED